MKKKNTEKSNMRISGYMQLSDEWNVKHSVNKLLKIAARLERRAKAEAKAGDTDAHEMLQDGEKSETRAWSSSVDAVTVDVYGRGVKERKAELMGALKCLADENGVAERSEDSAVDTDGVSEGAGEVGSAEVSVEMVAKDGEEKEETGNLVGETGVDDDAKGKEVRVRGRRVKRAKKETYRPVEEN